MPPDPLIYCLEQLTDYDAFERLGHDLMSLSGYPNLEPLGGVKDKGRDALHHSAGVATVFAYSVREDWKKKLDEDAEKVKRHNHPCNKLVFLCTARFTASERDKAVASIRTKYGWELELHGLERVASLLRGTHAELVAKHPGIFAPPFFPRAGGLSLSPSLDHVLIDHIDADAPLAHWLARRLMLAGYLVWCRGLAPLAGTSVAETVRGLLNARAARYVSILSAEAASDPDFTMRRSMAHAFALQRGSPFSIPVLARDVDPNSLDQETRRLSAACFQRSWASGLKSVLDALSDSGCPNASGGTAFAVQSFFPTDLVENEPEALASNVFRVVKFPRAILRYTSTEPLEENDERAATWGHRRVANTHFLSFIPPPPDLERALRMRASGGTVWDLRPEMDGIAVRDLLPELIKKTIYAHCRARGLCYSRERDLTYFPPNLLRSDRLYFESFDGRRTNFATVGARSYGRGPRAASFRYHLAPGFSVQGDGLRGFEVLVQTRVYITDTSGAVYPEHGGNRRRKKLCKSWWNDDWLNRACGIMQYLAEDREPLAIGDDPDRLLLVNTRPQEWLAPVRLNESALGDAAAALEDEILPLHEDEESDDDDR